MSDVTIDIFLPTSLRPGQIPQRQAMPFNIASIRAVQSRQFDDHTEVKSIILLHQKQRASDGGFLIDGFFSPLTAEEIKRLICTAPPLPISPHLFPKPRLVSRDGTLINPVSNISCG